MKKNLNLAVALGLLAVIGMAATPAKAQKTPANNIVSNDGSLPPLLDEATDRFTLTANVGAVYNFASNGASNGASGDNVQSYIGKVALAYGASLGWTSKTGFGLSTDYLGFNNAWQDVSAGAQYDATYNAVTFTPSYRFSFGRNREWGLRVGIGFGIGLADVKWAKGAGATNGASSSGGINWGTPAAKRSAGGASYDFNRITLFWNPAMGVGDRGYHDLNYPGSVVADNITPFLFGAPVDLNVTDADLATNHAGMGAISLTTLCAGVADMTKVTKFNDSTSPAGSGLCAGNFFAPNIGSSAASTANDVQLGRYLYGIGLSYANVTTIRQAGSALIYSPTGGGETKPQTGADATHDVVITRVICDGTNAATCNTNASGRVVDPNQKSREFMIGTNGGVSPVSQTVIDTIQSLENANGMLGGSLVGTNLTTALTGNISAVLWSTALTNMGGDNDKMNRVVTAINNAVATGSIMAASPDPVTIPFNVWNQLTPAAQSALSAAGGVMSAGGASSSSSSSSSGGSTVKEDAGFILAPQMAVEYDNGLFHGDLSIRYLHQLAEAKFDGQNGAIDQSQMAGPLAVFVGAGFGFNF